MGLVRAKMYTIDDIMELPEGQRAELVDGEMHMMASPSTAHQMMVSFLHFEIRQYIQRKRGGCIVLPSPFAVFLERDIYTYLEPDLTVVCDRGKLDERGCHGAPDWVIEVTSPGSRQMDYLTKLLKYQRAGVREYWVVDLEKERVLAYFFEQGSIAEYTFSEEAPSFLLDGLRIDFSNWEGGSQGRP